jgi:murein DD-endopeptidase MepM/ murein hydrolase activator NlpD
MRRGCLAVLLFWALGAEGEVHYRLPWPEGLSFMFTQVADGRVTTHFTKSTLNAIDIAMPVGIPVLAARSGVVEALEADHRSGPEDEAITYEGNFVRVRHDDGTAATYAHLGAHDIAVKAGEPVREGQLLAYSGASGDVSQPHLHFVVTRTRKNASGWSEEISVPVQFYVGVPPVSFPPRAALTVTAKYSGPAPVPRAPSDWQPLVPWKPTVLGPWAEAAAWALLAACFASGVAGMMWFWRFSRD